MYEDVYAYAPQAGNDTVPISVWRSGVHSLPSAVYVSVCLVVTRLHCTVQTYNHTLSTSMSAVELTGLILSLICS